MSRPSTSYTFCLSIPYSSDILYSTIVPRSCPTLQLIIYHPWQTAGGLRQYAIVTTTFATITLGVPESPSRRSRVRMRFTFSQEPEPEADVRQRPPCRPGTINHDPNPSSEQPAVPPHSAPPPSTPTQPMQYLFPKFPGPGLY